MAIPVIMPKQGQSVESCILTGWNKKKGDPVKKGDILFSYETDKASFEAEAEAEGILLDTFISDGEEVPVLTNVAVIGKPGESVDEYRPGQPGLKTIPDSLKAAETKEESSSPKQVSMAEPVKALENAMLKISPRARRLAEEKSVPLKGLKGSGPEGRIIESDVLQHLAEHPRITPLAAAAGKSERLSARGKGTGLAGTLTAEDLTRSTAGDSGGYTDKPLTNIRKIIAKAMHASLQQSAQLTHHMGADVSRLLEVRKKVKALQEKGYPHNITLNDMICFAVIRALQKHPAANAHFLGDCIRNFSAVHLGLAVDTDRGLMVPALLNASDLSLLELSHELKKVADQCRNGSINPDLLVPASATFTVSNLGNYGVELFTPVINLPQVAILGVNTITYRPVPIREYNVAFVPYIGLSLTYDHRAIDGGPATIFLAEIRNEIENFNEKTE